MNVQRQLQSHAQTGIVEVIAGDLANPIESIEDGVAMDSQPLRCFFRAPIGGKKRIQRRHQIGIVLSVVGEEQLAKRSAGRDRQFGNVLGGKNQSVDAEIAKERQVTRPLQPATEQQRLPCFGVRTPDALDPFSNRASPDREGSVVLLSSNRPRKSSRSASASRLSSYVSSAGSTNSAALLRTRHSTRPPRVDHDRAGDSLFQSLPALFLPLRRGWDPRRRSRSGPRARHVRSGGRAQATRLLQEGGFATQGAVQHLVEHASSTSRRTVAAACSRASTTAQAAAPRP